MATITDNDVLLPNDSENTIGENRALMLDPTVGGQQGPHSDPANWSSSAAYVRQKLIAVLIEAPVLLDKIDSGVSQSSSTTSADNKTRSNILKHLVELMPVSIEGLNSTLEVEFGEHKVSNAGELHHVMTKVSRTPSTPTFTWDEKYGKIVYNFFHDWIVYLLADPETTYPRLVADGNYSNEEFLPHNISMTVLFIEPSPTMHSAVSAWLCTNMMPRTSGTNEGKRIIGEANEIVQQAIEFTATTQTGKHVTDLANQYLESLRSSDSTGSIAGLNSDILPAFSTTNSESVSGLKSAYKAKLDTVANATDGSAGG